MDTLTEKEASDLIDKVSRNSGMGKITSATANTIRGINYRSVGSPSQANKDNAGLTFFTRPRLNLSYDNIAETRVLSPLLPDATHTLPRAIRTLLDPVGAKAGITTPLVDNLSPFIPMLTNNLLSLSGWPDMNVDTYTSPEGLKKESYSMVDSRPINYGTFDLTASFRNLSGDPISALFYVWTQYATRVLEGSMVPYPEAIVENEIDYMTRIYRLVLDPTRTYVQKIAACGAAFPTAVPTGAAFNFNRDVPLSTSNSEVSIPFRCIGVEYNDPITTLEFNQVSILFNATMADGLRETMYTKLTNLEKDYFNYEGYPRISETSELEWWIPNARYYAIMNEQRSLLGV